MSMQNRERLRECFRAVFPDATDAQLDTASVNTMDAWDSVALVTLVTVIEEEFGTSVPPSEVETLNSFDDFLALVNR